MAATAQLKEHVAAFMAGVNQCIAEVDGREQANAWWLILVPSPMMMHQALNAQLDSIAELHHTKSALEEQHTCTAEQLQVCHPPWPGSDRRSTRK